MNYTLCNDTVTVYRNRGGKVARDVFTDAFFWMEEGVSYRDDAPERHFLLVIPGKVFLIPGDRALLGVGPEEISWDGFIPANVKGLVEIGRVRYFRGQNGEICHTEAEHPWN